MNKGCLVILAGITLLGESFSSDKLIGFVGIWIGLAIFSYSLIARKESSAATAG